MEEEEEEEGVLCVRGLGLGLEFCAGEESGVSEGRSAGRESKGAWEKDAEGRGRMEERAGEGAVEEETV